MNAFAAADRVLDAHFSDPHLSVACDYAPPPAANGVGAVTGARALFSGAEEAAEFSDFAARPLSDVLVIRVRVAEVTPAKDGVFTLAPGTADAAAWRVVQKPRRPDSARRVWHCVCVPDEEEA